MFKKIIYITISVGTDKTVLIARNFLLLIVLLGNKCYHDPGKERGINLNPYDRHGLFELFESVEEDPATWPRCCGVPMPPPGSIIRISRRPRQYRFRPEVGTELTVIACSNIGGINSHVIQVVTDASCLDLLTTANVESICERCANVSLDLLQGHAKITGTALAKFGVEYLFVGYGLDDDDILRGLINTSDTSFELTGLDLRLWGLFGSFALRRASTT